MIKRKKKSINNDCISVKKLRDPTTLIHSFKNWYRVDPDYGQKKSA